MQQHFVNLSEVYDIMQKSIVESDKMKWYEKKDSSFIGDWRHFALNWMCSGDCCVAF